MSGPSLEDVMAFVTAVERPVLDLVKIGEQVASALRDRGRDAVFDVEVEAAEAEADALEEAKLKGK